MDFRNYSEKDLELLQERRHYPPRFVIRVNETSAAEDCLVGFTFQGATQIIVKEIALTKGIVQMI